MIKKKYKKMRAKKKERISFNKGYVVLNLF